MADAGRSELPRRAALGVVDTWRRLNFEQRVAGIGALLLVVSTFGPFSFVEAALVLTGAAVLLLLRKRSQGREFHIPFGDGGVIAAAGAWSSLLIVLRLPDRPLGQSLLALVCAGILLVAGVAERRKRLPDDLPGPAPEAHQRGPEAVEWEEPTERRARGGRRRSGETPAAAASEAPTPRMAEPRAGEADTSPLGERRPRVGSSDAPTEVRGRRRRQRPRAEAETEPLGAPRPEAGPEPRPRSDADTEPLGAPRPRPDAGSDPAPEPPPGAQLELPDPPPPPPARGPNDPLPPPEFHLPGDDDEPPPPPPRR
jgi:hypothetical protein